MFEQVKDHVQGSPGQRRAQQPGEGRVLCLEQTPPTGDFPCRRVCLDENALEILPPVLEAVENWIALGGDHLFRFYIDPAKDGVSLLIF